MEIGTVRNLNVVACILFVIFGILIAAYYFFVFSFIFWFPFGWDNSDRTDLFYFCISIFLLYVFLLVIIAIILYRNTVRSIDEGDFDRGKRWTLYAAVLGLIFGFFSLGIITFILFILSYVFFDEALRPKYYYPYPYYPPGYYPPPPSGYFPPPDDYYHRRYKKKKEL